MNNETIMKLFKISQDENGDYDTFDSAIVAAPDEETARNMDPSTGEPMDEWNKRGNMWCSSADKVEVEYLGEASEGIQQGIICASFNAC